MAKHEFDPIKMGKTAGLMFGAWTAALWILATLGFYSGMADMLASCHLFFNMNIQGLLLGTAESLVYGFGIGYVFAWLYNKF